MMTMTVSISINVKARERSRSLGSVKPLKRRRSSEVSRLRTATASRGCLTSEVSGGDGISKREWGEDRHSRFENRNLAFAAPGPDTAGLYRQCKNVQALKRFNHPPSPG